MVDFSTFTTTRSGVVVEASQVADERFGFIGSIPNSVSIAQAGITATVAFERQILTGQEAPLGQQNIVDRMIINGREYLAEYESDIRRLTTTSPEGRTRAVRLNSQGKPEQLQFGQLASIFFHYDAHGRLSTVTHGSGDHTRSLEISYGHHGYLSEIKDPIGRSTHWNRDADGFSSSILLPGPRQLSIEHYPNGNIESVSPPARAAHEFVFNQADQVTQYAPPVALGSTAPTEYEYDVSHRLVRYQRQDGRTVDWDYVSGNIRSILAPDGEYQYFWSSGGRLRRVHSPSLESTRLNWSGDLIMSIIDDVSLSTVEYQYDENFWISSIKVNGSHVSFSYDEDGLKTQAGDLSLSYLQNAPLLESTALSLIADAWTYNMFGEPEGYSASFDTQPLLDFSYQRDELGRIIEVTEVLGSGSPTITEYSYDNAGRLGTVRINSAVVHEYTYDLNGNRTLNDGALASYDPQDRLLSYEDWDYSYTADGELLERTDAATGDSRFFEYDVLGNLDNVILENSTEISYQQDGLMRRASRTVNGTVTHRWAYQDGLNPVAELDADGNIVSRFVYASRGHVPDHMVRDGRTYRMISDHLGSVRLVVDADAGTVAQELAYGPFGEVLLDTNPGFQPFGYAGGLYDPATGLVRFGVRDYDSSIGRWLTKDPIGFRGGSTNLYEYVGSDPINRIDPTGKIGILGAGIGAAIGGVGGFIGALSSGADLGTAVIEGIAGAAGGAIAGLVPGGGLLRSVLVGGGIGGVSNTTVQSYNIATDECRSLRDFNVGAAAGSALGGALSGGLHHFAPSNAVGQLATGPRDVAIGGTFGLVGGALWQ